MNYTFTLIFAFLTVGSFAQTSDEVEVKATIDAFFEAFHKQDSTALKAMVLDNIDLQSIGMNQKGEAMLNTSDYDTFLKSIVSIPKEVKFREELLDYSIQVDGPMANAWTPYKFWVNEELSHCGVNSFQLFKQDDSWKIIYLVDTRRKDCSE